LPSNTFSSDTEAPDYDVDIDADELLENLVTEAVEYAEDYEEKRRWWTESLETAQECHEARRWMQQARGGQRAYSETIAALHPENHCPLVDSYRNDDGSVDVRGLLRWLSNCAESAHERRGTLNRNPQAGEAEHAYTRIISTLREEYGIGWPRLDDVGGNPLECDLP
jgi:hypothetical protein